MNSRYAKNLGDRGEAAAAEYLEKKGYTILNRNYYICHGEIDIIAKDGDCTVFVEVKTRRSDKYGSGLEAITVSKKEKSYQGGGDLCCRKWASPNADAL